jgi:GTP-binding protein HflX
MVRARIRRIEQELERLGRERGLQRERRRIGGFLLIGLTGYTNAGKSSLLNRLAGDQVLVEDRMFSTLSTTTRRMREMRKDILITDTIGFVRDLPPFMIEAFKSTMEEIYTADLVLLVVDGSESESSIMDKISTSMSIITPEVDPSNIIIVLNKSDVVDRSKDVLVLDIVNEFLCRTIVPASTLVPEGMDDLVRAIKDHFSYDIQVEIRAPQSGETTAMISWLHDNTDIEIIDHGEDVHVLLRCRERDLSRIERDVLSAGGTMSIDAFRRADGQNTFQWK